MLQSITEYAKAHNHPLIFQDPITMTTNVEHHSYIEETLSELKTLKHLSYDREYHKNHDIYMLMLKCLEGEEKAYESLFKELRFVRWHPKSVDVIAANGSKAVGVQKVIEYLGANEDDVYAFGDHLNDIEMFSVVKNSVAMGNALEEIKKIAKYETKHVDEGGIAYGLQMLGLYQP